MKIYVFAVGGTGARVLRSFTMLMAAGCKLPEDTTIVPVILDYDLLNGNFQTTEGVLEKYQNVRESAYKMKDTYHLYKDDSFFAAPIIRLDQIPVSGGASPLRQRTFHVSIEGEKDTFGKYIGYDLLTRGHDEHSDLSLTKDFLNVLYNNDPESHGRELHLQLNVGFKGNPNIGAVVFDKWIESEEFRVFEQSVGQDDRIFVVSSIFGGTGAAGFPKIIQRLRQPGYDSVQKAKIGAAIVMPYFKFGDDRDSAISASIFNSKTKAALNYYNSCRLNDSLDAIYYLSDFVDQADGMYKNVEGGQEQKNAAHVVELLAATAIVDFANKENFKGRRAFEFGLKEDLANVINISHFAERTKERYLNDLTKFTYFMQFYERILPNVRDKDVYNVKLDIKSQLAKKNDDTVFHTKLSNFFGEYRQWLKELKENTMRKFEPYRVEDSDPINELLSHKKLEKKGPFGLGTTPLRDDFFHEKMNIGYKTHCETITDNESIFLRISRDTMSCALDFANKY